MKLRKKDLLILIPLIVMGVLIIASIIYEYYTTEEIILSTQCQEGWFKYESEAGTLCSKTELSSRQIEEYGK